MAADCSNKDSEFYNDVFVSSPNLVTVETAAVLERQVTIVAAIPRFLTVANAANPLDIFKTTGGANKLIFSFELEKENVDGTWDYIEFSSSNLTTFLGESEVGSFVLGKCVYNAGKNIYDYQASIQGLSVGNYRLSFGYNSTISNLVEFRSESVGNNLFLNLNSPTSLVDTNGYYKFTIN